MEKKDPFDLFISYQQGLIDEKNARKRKTPNKAPELAVKNQMLLALKAKGFCPDIVESKSVMFKDSRGVKHFKSAGIKKGFADIIASDPDGIYCAIELKAPGKLKTVRPDQVNFLVRKIQHNCFAVVTDSVEHFFSIYSKWKALSFTERRPFLLAELNKLVK